MISIQLFGTDDTCCCPAPNTRKSHHVWWTNTADSFSTKRSVTGRRWLDRRHAAWECWRDDRGSDDCRRGVRDAARETLASQSGASGVWLFHFVRGARSCERPRRHRPRHQPARRALTARARTQLYATARSAAVQSRSLRRRIRTDVNLGYVCSRSFQRTIRKLELHGVIAGAAYHLDRFAADGKAPTESLGLKIPRLDEIKTYLIRNHSPMVVTIR